jgi:hypothetical protein
MERMPARAASNVPAASNATRRMTIGPALISGEIILPLPALYRYRFFANHVFFAPGFMQYGIHFCG